MNSMRVLLASTSIALVLLVACGGDTSSSGTEGTLAGPGDACSESARCGSGLRCASGICVAADDGGSGAACSPAEVRICSCSSGDEGMQQCRADGSGFAACECENTGPGGSGGAEPGGSGGAPPTGGASGSGGGDAGIDGSPTVRISCDSDLDCVPSGLLCDVSAAVCVECLTDEACAANELCNEGTCTEYVACSTSLDCAGAASGAVCDTALGRCVECTRDADCSGNVGQGTCVANQCTCGDLQTDPNNCGACGRICEDGCEAGACKPAFDESCVSYEAFGDCTAYCQSLGAACVDFGCDGASAARCTGEPFVQTCAVSLLYAGQARCCCLEPAIEPTL